MAKVVVFHNMKGGVGKSTLACLLASYYQYDLGRKVLMIDADTGQHTQVGWREVDLENLNRAKALISQEGIDEESVRNYANNIQYPHLLRALDNTRRGIGNSFYSLSVASLVDLAEFNLREADYDYVFVDLGGKLEKQEELESLCGMADYYFITSSTTSTDTKATLDYLLFLRKVMSELPNEHIPQLRLVWFKWQPFHLKITSGWEWYFGSDGVMGLFSQFRFVKGKIRFAEVGFNDRKLRSSVGSPFGSLDLKERGDGHTVPEYILATRDLLEEISQEL